MKKTASILMALLLALSLVACGGGDKGNALVGKWAFDVAAAASLPSGMTIPDIKAGMEFKADGTFDVYGDESIVKSLKTSMGDKGAKYKLEGQDGITITNGNTTSKGTYKIDGDKLTITINDHPMTLKRDKK